MKQSPLLRKTIEQKYKNSEKRWKNKRRRNELAEPRKQAE